MIYFRFLFILFSLVSFSLATTGQESEQFVPPEEVQEDPNMEGQLVSSSQLESEILSFLEPYIYDEEGRRDPFQPYADPNGISKEEESTEQIPIQSGDVDSTPNVADGPLGRYEVKELTLRAVLWSVNRPRALVLAPDEKTYILVEKDAIGSNGGYVAKIRESEVVVVEKNIVQNKEVVTTKIMRINRQ